MYNITNQIYPACDFPIVYFVFGTLLIITFYFTGTLLKPEPNNKHGRIFSSFSGSFTV